MDSFKTVGCTITGSLVLGDLRWLLEQAADYPDDSMVEVHTGQPLPEALRSPDIVIVRPFSRGGDDDCLPGRTQAR